MSEETIFPTLYFAYCVCMREERPLKCIKRIPKPLRKKVAQWLAREGLVRDEGIDNVDTDKLCRRYNFYLRCYNEQTHTITSFTDAVKKIETCLRIAGLT